MKTRSAILKSIGAPAPFATSRPLAVETIELDPPGDLEVLVRIRAAGLCHSDLSVMTGDRPRPTPMALGHEAAGEVVEAGKAVTDLKPGDHVVMVFVPSCGGCVPCMEGRPALCEPGAAANTAGTLLSGARRIHLHGQDVHHHLGVSAFSEYAVVSRRSLIKVDATLPFEEAALFGCAVLTGVGAVTNTAKVAAGTTVAVIGLGGVGLNSLLAAEMAGAAKVIAIDLHPAKLEIAKKLGATHVVNAASPDAVKEVKDITSGGVDYAFEMAGVVPAMDLAYKITRRGGMTVTAGLSNPSQMWPVQHVNIVAEERTIKGSYIGSCVPVRDIPRYIALYQRGKLPVNKLMSDIINFDGLNAAFDNLAAGNAIRQILVP